MNHLTKSSKTYLMIKHALWALLVYYTKLFGFKTPRFPENTNIKLNVDATGVTHLLVGVERIDCGYTLYTCDAMKTIMNEYIDVVLFKDYPELKSFSMGTGNYDIMKCLYVYKITHNNTYYTIDIIYVDCPLAFHKVKNDQNSKGVEL